mmetsp:Transcript_29964/g.66340  ORF Transcript_29964/g.66340 Transcript_29964/m.66340 type:complete len:1040 (+) Transcript_29964:120-3239(+)
MQRTGVLSGTGRQGAVSISVAARPLGVAPISRPKMMRCKAIASAGAGMLGLRCGAPGPALLRTFSRNRGSVAMSAAAVQDAPTTRVELPKNFEATTSEPRLYKWWEDRGYFKPNPAATGEPFVISMPPPNVTGRLHMGHAMFVTLQDVMIRYARMRGKNTLWLPGTDHAGIATQSVVEKMLAKDEGVSRLALGREAFTQRVWEWKAQYGGFITEQLRRLGASCDWTRERFTLDEGLSNAVAEAFVRLHDEGLIYRGSYMVNWSPSLLTAVSDLEVEYSEEQGSLFYFKYPVADMDGEFLPVATTRPETILGDTAVAVHPEDERYKKYIGKECVVPCSGGRRIPIIADEYVDREFGTGALKITPGHDINDYEIGKRRGLPTINIMNKDATLNAAAGRYSGMERFAARKALWADMEAEGLVIKKEPHTSRVPRSQRSGEIIEPLVSEQWFVRMAPLAAPALEAVQQGNIRLIPDRFEKIYNNWLENIKDWCISRQLWWGHRIPVWYVFSSEAEAAAAPEGRSDKWVVARSEAEALDKARGLYGQGVALRQEEDVLDTWFSSGLWPFSTLGWPNAQAPDLKTFYPTQVMETGHDILFFWVARMVMMGIQLTGQVPFKQVYLHAMVRDAHGRKMSKSLGNVIDPLHVIEGISLEGLHETLLGGNLEGKEVERAKAGQKADFPEGIEECGTDALRFALVAYTTQARDINLDIKRVVAYRHWCNKLWNAIRFAMMNLPADFVPASDEEIDASLPSFPLPSQWILSRLNGAVAAVVKALEEYDFATATQRLYAFWQYDLCDVFIELMKPVMARDETEPGAAAAKASTRNTLWVCLETGLRLLHPFMPFVTEELWQRLPKRAGGPSVPSIMLADYPSPSAARDNSQLEKDFDFATTVITRTRKLRSDYGLVKQKPHLYVACTDEGKHQVLTALSSEVATLTTSSEVSVLPPGTSAPSGCSVGIVDDSTTLHMLLKGILDPALEIQKLQKKVAEVEGRIDGMKRKMALPTYDKTPDNVKADDKERMSKAEAELSAAHAAIADFQKLLQ